jgi:hypothetical protein
VDAGRVRVDGEAAAWTSLLATLDPPDPGFDIVLP